MAFNFRLERVFNYKRYRVRQLQVELGQRLQEKLDLDRQLCKLSEQKLSYIRQLSELLTGNLSLADVNTFIVNIEVVEHQISLIKQQLHLVEDALEQIREKLKLARKEEKILSSLQQRQLAHYLKEMEYKEQVYADEIANYLYIKKMVPSLPLSQKLLGELF